MIGRRNYFGLIYCVLASVFLTNPTVGQSVYTRDNAEYVDRTPSYSVLDYVICLAQSVDMMADALFVSNELPPEAKACQRLADLIPDSPRNPQPEDILQRIRECGFWPKDAKPEVDCTEGNLMSAEAGSWGGKVRSGPGMNYHQLSSLAEGDPVTLLSDTGLVMNGYPWFRIRYHGNQVGYQWGGILCAIDAPIVGLFQTCNAYASSVQDNEGNTLGLSEQAMLAFADDLLNKVYQNQINSLDSEGATLLRSAQRAWVSYRDKECARRSHVYQSDMSAQSINISCRTELTAQRTKELN